MILFSSSLFFVPFTFRRIPDSPSVHSSSSFNNTFSFSKKKLFHQLSVRCFQGKKIICFQMRLLLNVVIALGDWD